MIKKEHNADGVKSYAIFSDCEKYRYILTRMWDEHKSKIVFIGLNPSTANEIKNDPTVTRMIKFAKSWRYGSISVCNLFGFRATFPEDLKKAQNPVGKENDELIIKEIKEADKVIAAWGNHGKFKNRSYEMLQQIAGDNLYSFGKTNQGEPKHVLYLRNNAEISKYYY